MSLIIIDKLTEDISTAPHMSTETLSIDSRTETHGSLLTCARLLMLQLRPFGGELNKWTGFWDSFESTVHNNRDLSDTEKFNYFSSLLERSAISGLSSTTVNYYEAIATLNKRFRSKQQAVNKHTDVLLHVEAVTAVQKVKVYAVCLIMPAPMSVVCNH